MKISTKATCSRIKNYKRNHWAREACQKNLGEINEEELITVFRITVSSCEIWDGLGDRGKDDYYCINKEGWLEKSVITGIGQYQKSDSGVISQTERVITDEAIQSILNGDCDMFTIKEFINFYDNIYNKYSSDFR